MFQLVLNQIINVKGGINYKLPHMNKDKWVRENGRPLPTRLECTDPELQPRATTALTIVSPGGSVAAPMSPSSEDDVTMQEANHNDAALTLLSLLGQCSLQDVDSDEEEVRIFQLS
jgi:hypothetical protein